MPITFTTYTTMKFEESVGTVFLTACFLLTVTLIGYLVALYRNNGLNRYPAPCLANFSKLWLRMDVKTNQHQHHLLELHRKHGPVVRIGPNNLSIASPDCVSPIYGVKNEFLKSDMYDVFAPRVNGRPVASWLSVREPEAHARIKKPVASAYSLSALKEYEPLVDDMIIKFMDRLDETVKVGNPGACDMATWLRLYAFDVILHLTFSDTLGFLDAGADVNEFMVSLDKNMDRTGLLLTMPWTVFLVKHNPIVGWFKKDSTIFPTWVGKQIHKRIESRSKMQAAAPKDFLDRFLDAGATEKAPGYNVPLIRSWTMTNVMAGADTTSIGLRAILYYVLKSKVKKNKLLYELRSSNLHHPVTWEESQQLPYLDACIKEAFRLHPAIGMGLERTVPVSGLLLPDGYTLPAGTNVSINAWVLNRHVLFGEHPDEFIPERWLQQNHESTEVFRERIKMMKHADLTFGGGSRTCAGKYISFLETYKVIPTLLLEYDIGLLDEAGEWGTTNRWTVRQEDIGCWLSRKSR